MHCQQKKRRFIFGEIDFVIIEGQQLGSSHMNDIITVFVHLPLSSSCHRTCPECSHALVTPTGTACCMECFDFHNAV